MTKQKNRQQNHEKLIQTIRVKLFAKVMISAEDKSPLTKELIFEKGTCDLRCM